MEERVGSFVIDEQGNLVPNLNDEAMAERKRLEQQATNNGGTEVAN